MIRVDLKLRYDVEGYDVTAQEAIERMIRVNLKLPLVQVSSDVGHALHQCLDASVVGEHTRFERNNRNRLANKATYALETDTGSVLQLVSLFSAFVIHVHSVI